MVNDTMTLSGSEVYLASLSYYNSVKGAPKDNQPGAKVIYDDLKTQFPRTGIVMATVEPIVAK